MKTFLFTLGLTAVMYAGTMVVPPVAPVEPVEEKCPCKCKG